MVMPVKFLAVVLGLLTALAGVYDKRYAAAILIGAFMLYAGELYTSKYSEIQTASKPVTELEGATPKHSRVLSIIRDKSPNVRVGFDRGKGGVARTVYIPGLPPVFVLNLNALDEFSVREWRAILAHERAHLHEWGSLVDVIQRWLSTAIIALIGFGIASGVFYYTESVIALLVALMLSFPFFYAGFPLLDLLYERPVSVHMERHAERYAICRAGIPRALAVRTHRHIVEYRGGTLKRPAWTIWSIFRFSSRYERLQFLKTLQC